MNNGIFNYYNSSPFKDVNADGTNLFSMNKIIASNYNENIVKKGSYSKDASDVTKERRVKSVLKKEFNPAQTTNYEKSYTNSPSDAFTSRNRVRSGGSIVPRKKTNQYLWKTPKMELPTISVIDYIIYSISLRLNIPYSYTSCKLYYKKTTDVNYTSVTSTSPYFNLTISLFDYEYIIYGTATDTDGIERITSNMVKRYLKSVEGTIEYKLSPVNYDRTRCVSYNACNKYLFNYDDCKLTLNKTMFLSDTIVKYTNGKNVYDNGINFNISYDSYIFQIKGEKDIQSYDTLKIPFYGYNQFQFQYNVKLQNIQIETSSDDYTIYIFKNNEMIKSYNKTYSVNILDTTEFSMNDNLSIEIGNYSNLTYNFKVIITYVLLDTNKTINTIKTINDNNTHTYADNALIQKDGIVQTCITEDNNYTVDTFTDASLNVIHNFYYYE